MTRFAALKVWSTIAIPADRNCELQLDDYYAEHFTPNLTLTKGADRVAKRGGGGGGTGGGGVKRQRGSVCARDCMLLTPP